MSLSRRRFLIRSAAAAAALSLGRAAEKPAAADPAPSVTPVADAAALMPRYGTVSTQPAGRWEDSLLAGNGIMGALLYGDPFHDTLVANHCKLWLPLGSREVLPQLGEALPQMRQVIGQQGYGAGHQFFLDTARKGGWNGSLVWTDPTHPGFFLTIDQPSGGAVTEYARVEDFAAGEVWAQWRTPQGAWTRRMFVSKPDNLIVVTTTGPRGSVSQTVTMQKVDNEGINSAITHADGWITGHNVYVKGKGGYDAAVRVISHGGTQASDGHSVTITNADSVTLLMRLQPWKIPYTDTQAWGYSAGNPDFRQKSQWAGLYRAAPAYNPQWMTDLARDLSRVSEDDQKLRAAHSAEWAKIYSRVSVDFHGTPAERGLSSEALLDLAQSQKRMPNALLERMYDAGRYIFLCSAGPETPPNLFGIWTGTWHPAWSGDYTTDTNLQLDIDSAYSANMAEAMAGFFNLWDSYLPDFRRNAHSLYNCRGILTGTRHSNVGINLHWDGGWPGEMWTPGAAWIAHFYYDHFQYTGDKTFLRERAIPFMEECALFYEDFLKGSEDARGFYTFRPSYSAENGWGDNSSQDIEICTELLTNLIAGCDILGIKPEEVARWKTLLAKLPPLMINAEGQLQEWSNADDHENNDHRHLMHLYGAFQAQQFSEEADPALFAAARVALNNRIRDWTSGDDTHGFTTRALAADELLVGDAAYDCLAQLAIRRSIYPGFVDGHFGGPNTLCDDGNGVTPEIVNRMFVQSQMSRLMLLPAVPAALPQGSLRGLRARGAITIQELTWDMTAGTVRAVVTADAAQNVILVLPPGASVSALTINGQAQEVTEQGVRKQGCRLSLPGGKPVTIEAQFHV